MNTLTTTDQSQSHPQTQALGIAESSRKTAEVQAALTVAAARPRNTVAAMDRIANACGRLRLAESSTYQFARGGQDITGPSIRLLEAIAGAWGNLEYGFRELSQGNGESTVEAFAWDLETNNKATKTFIVPHKIGLRGGRTKELKDPRDVYEWVANQAQRRVRACLENVIPRDVVEDAVDQCTETLKAQADVSPENVAKLVEAFAAEGVHKPQIELRIQRRLAAIQPGQLIQLRRIYTSLKDGMSIASDWFQPIEDDKPAKPGLDQLTDQLAPENTPSEPPEPADWANKVNATDDHEKLIELAAELDADDSVPKAEKTKLARVIQAKLKK